MPAPFLPDALTSPADLRQPIGHVLWFRSDGLWLVDPQTGDLQRAQMEAEAAAWSPGGDYLAVLGPPWPGQQVPDGTHILTVYDLAAGQRCTYPNVHLVAHGGVAWQETGGALALYAISAGSPNCLLRFDPARGEFRQTLCAETGTRFAGDIAALPDGRLAYAAIAGESAALRLVDPATGAVQDIPLWAGSGATTALRIPLSLSPDGRSMAALRGPEADPGERQIEQQGLYLLDVAAGKVERVFTLPGLYWSVWSPDGMQLALAGDSQRFGYIAIYVYERATGNARPLDDAGSGLISTFISSSPVSRVPASVPLAWLDDGRLLVGLNPLPDDASLIHPRLAWIDMATEKVSLAAPFGQTPRDWPIYTIPGIDLAVRYPPGWAVQEWQAHADEGFALGSTNWIPARYDGSSQPQVPMIYLTLYRPPLTGTLEAWLDAHGTAASFGTESGDQVGFWGVSHTMPTAAGGYPALRFTHEAFGLRVHELLLAVGNRVAGLGYADLGGEDLGLAFTRMQMELARAEAALPAGWPGKGDMAGRLVAEEYPIVDQKTDGPYRMEYWARIGSDILERRRAMRVARSSNWDGLGDPPPILTNGKSIALHIDWQYALLTVSGDGKALYALTVPGFWVDVPLKAFLPWGEHWVVEAGERVIVDGTDINRALGYDTIFGWRLVQDRPFFFFRRGAAYGISYDGQELAYRYDDIVHYMCCEPAMFNTAGNETMVWFHALRDGTWYYVEMGVYE